MRREGWVKRGFSITSEKHQNIGRVWTKVSLAVELESCRGKEAGQDCQVDRKKQHIFKQRDSFGKQQHF